MRKSAQSIRWLLAWLGCGVILVLTLTILLPPSVYSDGGTTPTPTLRKMADPQSWMNPPPPGNTQADQGAYTYWMHCMVCHGNLGQGLALFRSYYPKQDQDCASPKCHGGPHPGAGFSFPDAPAIIGPNTLTQFKTAADLYAFISTRMPYQTPGILSSEEYWGLVAYLLRQHQVLPAHIQLDASDAGLVPINPNSTPAFSAPAIVAIALLMLVLFVSLLLVLQRRRAGAGGSATEKNR